ncbi:MAG TPA: hypothetical protein VJH33_00265 [Candidatus Paceibacterota bacterium]
MSLGSGLTPKERVKKALRSVSACAPRAAADLDSKRKRTKVFKRGCVQYIQSLDRVGKKIDREIVRAIRKGTSDLFITVDFELRLLFELPSSVKYTIPPRVQPTLQERVLGRWIKKRYKGLVKFYRRNIDGEQVTPMRISWH